MRLIERWIETIWMGMGHYTIASTSSVMVMVMVMGNGDGADRDGITKEMGDGCPGMGMVDLTILHSP